MQSVSTKIWTCVAVSISYDGSHYTTGTSSRDRWVIGKDWESQGNPNPVLIDDDDLIQILKWFQVIISI